MPYCLFCKREFDAWLPYRIVGKDISDFLIRADVIGSNSLRMWCPHCHSFDRERHLKLFFDALELWPAFKGASVLHMAPEMHLRKAIRACEPTRYVQGDLFLEDAEFEKIDLEHIDYEERTFDVVLANHMLEHVTSPRAALAEVRRVLRPGGRFVCQTPYAARLSRTFEDPAITSPEDRLFFYGQDDHVRLFGTDIAETIRNAGFAGSLRPHDSLVSDIDPERYGVNEHEPFFDFVAV